MHDCLRVQDIIYDIIKIFAETRDRRSIAAIARTCKSFHEPAMDALWRKLDGLGPLLECMPSDLICERYIPATWAEPYLDVQAVRLSLTLRMLCLLIQIVYISVSRESQRMTSGIKCSSTHTACAN